MSSTGRVDRGPVVTSIVGNLGNQLFQFAVAKAIQPDPAAPAILDTRLDMDWPLRLGTVLDASAFRAATSRELITLGQVPHLVRGQRTAMGWHERSWLGQRAERRVFQEHDAIGFDPRIEQIAGPILLRGYFQSETYFESSADVVLASFRRPPRSLLDDVAALRTELGADRPLVGVSLRTGLDYQHFGWILPTSFYDEALARIEVELGPVNLVVFGDVQEHCDALVATYRAQGRSARSVAGSPVAMQLHLLAHVDHLIIANSSFAWWGAWLGDHWATPASGARIVCCPRPWLEPDDAVAPSRWIELDRPIERRADPGDDRSEGSSS